MLRLTPQRSSLGLKNNLSRVRCRYENFVRVSRQGASLICAAALLVTSFAYSFGQQPAATKRPLRHQDYDSWHSIQAPQISRDGKFVAYAFMAQDGAQSNRGAGNVATGF